MPVTMLPLLAVVVVLVLMIDALLWRPRERDAIVAAATAGTHVRRRHVARQLVVRQRRRLHHVAVARHRNPSRLRVGVIARVDAQHGQRLRGLRGLEGGAAVDRNVPVLFVVVVRRVFLRLCVMCVGVSGVSARG